MTQNTQQRSAAPETTSDATTPISRGRVIMAVAVCWILVVFDGYDLIVYGTVQSSLLAESDWGLTPASLGTVGSMAFIGMMIGALLAGRIADTLGRRRTILACSIMFSVLTIACAFAPNAWVFGALRLLAGIGLGGLVPSANAMVAAVALVVVVPLGFKFLPETLPSQDPAPAAEGSKKGEKPTTSGAGFSSLLRAPYVGISVLFALITLFTLFAWYGLGTWLPNLMERAGYDLGSALTFALSLNLGAVVGSVVTAWAGDRFGPVRAGAAAAGLAGVALLVLLYSPPV